MSHRHPHEWSHLLWPNSTPAPGNAKSSKHGPQPRELTAYWVGKPVIRCWRVGEAPKAAGNQEKGILMPWQTRVRGGVQRSFFLKRSASAGSEGQILGLKHGCSQGNKGKDNAGRWSY